MWGMWADDLVKWNGIRFGNRNGMVSPTLFVFSDKIVKVSIAGSSFLSKGVILTFFIFSQKNIF